MDFNTVEECMKEVINIAICDDDKIMIDMIYKKICSIIDGFSNIKDYNIDCYSSGPQLLESSSKYHLYLLDVDMPNMDGFELGKKLNETYISPVIIYLTNHTSLAMFGYKVRAFRYLSKKRIDEELQEAMEEVIHEIFPKAYLIPVEEGADTIYVDVNNIIYIESHNKKSDVQLVDEYLLGTYPLSKWIELLPEYMFTQIHKSRIINLKHLDRVQGTKAIMINGCELQISMRKKKILEKAKIEFIRIDARR